MAFEAVEKPLDLPDEPSDEDDEELDEAVLQRQEEAFQKQYECIQSWDQLQEDEFGNLYVDKTAKQKEKRRQLLATAQTARIRKGLIRYVLLVLDLTQATLLSDLKPNRMVCMATLCRGFVRDFFDQNPLSQLGVAVMRDGLVEKLTDLSGTPRAQVAKLSIGSLGAPGGAASLQNALDLGESLLSQAPPYGHREVVILLAALSTCDPGNVFDSIRRCKEKRIRVSIVGVAAEVYICRRAADETGGRYGVAMSEAHLKELLMAHSLPPPTTSKHVAADLVSMGFPQRSAEDSSGESFVGLRAELLTGGYTCPRCKARVHDLPCQCHVCGLTLISSQHLVRSYHHLFPVNQFREVTGARELWNAWVIDELGSSSAADREQGHVEPKKTLGNAVDLRSTAEMVSDPGRRDPHATARGSLGSAAGISNSSRSSASVARMNNNRINLGGDGGVSLAPDGQDPLAGGRQRRRRKAGARAGVRNEVGGAAVSLGLQKMLCAAMNQAKANKTGYLSLDGLTLRSGDGENAVGDKPYHYSANGNPSATPNTSRNGDIYGTATGGGGISAPPFSALLPSAIQTPATYCFGCFKDLSFSLEQIVQRSLAAGGGRAAGEASKAPSAAVVGESQMVLLCDECGEIFCAECDVYVHENLHNCPGCELRGR